MRPLLLLAAALCALASHLTAGETPNVIVILADDLGYGSVGCYGADPALVSTPHIDRSARQGRRFTDGNTTSSVCSPTRYSLLTGRYCWRTSEKSGVLGVFSPLHIETTRLTLASLLKSRGYLSAAIGKWHLGYGTSNGSPRWRTDFAEELSPGPLDIGFHYHFAVPANHGDVTGVFVENRFVYGLRSSKVPPDLNPPTVSKSSDLKATYTTADLENQGKGVTILDLDAPRRVNERVMPVLTDQAIRWIEETKGDLPFFLYFTPVAVHNPITPDRDLAGKSAAGLYGDWIHELDRSVGRILEVLDREDLAKDTIVIFTSDNGGVTGSTRPDSAQGIAEKAGLKINGSLKGRKHSVWEGGFKVPFIVRWPGRAPAGTVCDEMVSVVDLFATIAAIVGERLPSPAVAAEDSRSFLPAILGEKAAPAREDMIVHSSDGIFAIRKGPWKWIEGIPADDAPAASRKVRSDEFRPQLYNTLLDPAETKDVSSAHPEIVQELSALLNRYRDGGYSRVLPPVVEKQLPVVATLPPLTGTLLLDETLDRLPGDPWSVTRGIWEAKDGALWGKQKAEDTTGATMRVPLALTEGTVQDEIRFHGTSRHSLRIETAGRKQSFRIEVSRTKLGITKNPSVGEGKDKTEPLATKTLSLDADTWYPLRLTIRGGEAVAEIAGVSLQASHPVIGEPKAAFNLLVFGDSIAFRKMIVANP